jgi:DMSO/TMAO reductase YedYZ molybdopterin-dependent catalytic subunit
MSRKLLCAFILAVLFTMAACQHQASPTAASGAVSSDIVLEVDGPKGTQTFTLDELMALPAAEGYAGFMSSTGKVYPPLVTKGIRIMDLANMVSDYDATYGIEISAVDGYSMTFSYDQIANGAFTTYDPGTGKEFAYTAPLTPILAYMQDGKLLDPQTDGYLRLEVLSDVGDQVVDGHWTVKWVNKISVVTLPTEWTVHLEGVLVEDMDRATFESGAAPGCHGYMDEATDTPGWTDSNGHVWEGIPLWRLVGKVDENGEHTGDYFDDALAQAGYTVEVVSADGTSVIFDSQFVARNDNIIVAYQMDGAELAAAEFPLKLVGSDVSADQSIGQISSIIIHFNP